VQDCFENEEEFNEIWVCKDDAEKTELLGTYMLYAVGMGIKTDKDLMKYIGLSIVGLDANFDTTDEDEEEEIQEVVVPTIQQPTQDTTELQNRIRELEEENRKLKARPETEKKEKVEGRGKGRPPKNSNTGAFKCELCNICLASHGSLHNHYESKPHNAKVMNVLNESKKHVEKGLNTKIIVKVRSHLDDPKYTKEDPDTEHLDNIIDYVKDGHNPITDILLVHRENKEVSWNKMC
jgi:hypothetical protein